LIEPIKKRSTQRALRTQRKGKRRKGSVESEYLPSEVNSAPNLLFAPARFPLFWFTSGAADTALA
jgi:hypothetical protein